MSFSEPAHVVPYSASNLQAVHHDFSGSGANAADINLLEKIVEHVLELPAKQENDILVASSAVNTLTSGKNSRNPYLGWARCPTFSIPPRVAQKMAISWTGTETYEGFFSKLENSKKTTSLSSPAIAAAGGSYYRRNYDSSPHKTPRTSPHRVASAPVAFTSPSTAQSSNHSMDVLTKPPPENGTVDPRLVCPPPLSNSYIDVSYNHSVPIKATHKPLPGFEVSFAERELIKMFPSYCQSIKVIPAIIFCNRCKQEIPTNPQAITQHAAIHLINPKEDPNKFGCLVGNCWRRLPLTQLGAHVAGHFKTASASCGICGFIFPSPRLAREHLVSPCPQLQNAQSNFLANHPTDRKTQESIFRRLL